MPTLKQKKAIKKVVENHGNVSRAMIEVGYDPTTAKNPKNLTESKGWKELLDQYLPDNKLLEKHDKLLDSDNEMVVHNAVHLGYRVKGKLQPEIANTINVGEMSVMFKEK